MLKEAVLGYRQHRIAAGGCNARFLQQAADSSLTHAQVFYGKWRGRAVAVKLAPPEAQLRPATVAEFRCFL